MTHDLTEVVKRLSSPLDAQPTGLAPRLKPLPGIRAVLFDIYGTMLISGSGEVGTVDRDAPAAFREALESMGIRAERLPAAAGLETTIRQHHARSRAEGNDYPEVEIRDVWLETLTGLVEAEHLELDVERCDVERLSVEYECRMNPVWPMPHLESCLASLRGNRVLGIVSNAQFFTPLLFPALLGVSLRELGFDPEMQYFSYALGVAKPSPEMFRRSLTVLADKKVAATETIYVGNDMLNDVSTAAQVGMKTALFAGDRRSLRLREGDSRVSSQPDIVLSDLRQLTECIL